MMRIANPALRCVLIVFALSIAGRAAPPVAPAGLQLYSLRLQAMRDMRGALDQARSLGFREIEIAGTGALSAADFAQELRARRLTAIGAHTRYVQLQKGIAGAILEAKTIGAKYVITSLPKPIVAQVTDENGVGEIARLFNEWGEACREAGLQFACHTHGAEFYKVAPNDETIFDVLMRKTKPELVALEMDVYWVFLAGQDPAELLRKNPGRWQLMHLKDLRKGVGTGVGAVSAPATDNVAVGEGQIDWPAVLEAARAAGIRHYFIEDESASPLDNIPRSLDYLQRLDVGRAEKRPRDR